MAIAKMKLVNIVGRLEDFDNTVRTCCLNGEFHPEKSSDAVKNTEQFVPIEEFNPYSQDLQKLVDVAAHSNIDLKYNNFDKLSMNDEQLETYVDTIKAELESRYKVINSLSQDIANLKQGLTQLSHIKNFDVNLDDVFSCKFFTVRFGHLPKDNYPKLELCDMKDDLFFFPLEEDNQYIWGFYVAINTVCDKVDQLFTSLYFERIIFPSETHGTPQEAIDNLNNQVSELNSKLEIAKKDITDYLSKNLEEFLTVYSKIKYLCDSFDVRKFASKHKDTFYIIGWVPEDNAESFKLGFDSLSTVDCVVEGIDQAEGIVPPTKLKHNVLTSSFELITGLYGLPSYNEVDPTTFMAITYTLFFGIMFGDLGQGILIFLAGLLCHFKKIAGKLSGVLMSFGIASTVMGFLYNSVFGHEGVLPFTILPVHDDANITTVLFSAVGLGVITILTCMVVNMINGIKQKDTTKIFFGCNGIAGFVFYASIIIGCVFTILLGKNIMNIWYILGLIILPVIIIFLQVPLARLCEHKKDIIPGSKGEFFLTAFFELFENMLSFFSNTISFMRIGAYILSHAGMMMAVFAIGNMFSTTGSIITQVIGNVFVIALEGLIVGIQGIRLHFYEMFSRFYSGDGKPYDPLKIDY